MKVKVIQCDNRIKDVGIPTPSFKWTSLLSISPYHFKRKSLHWFSTKNYIHFTTFYNQIICKNKNWDYSIEYAEGEKPAQYNKLYVLQNHLSNNKEYDIFIYLDTDSWIADPEHLQSLLENFIHTKKIGIFSRDPYLKQNTYINSGVIIIKTNAEAQNFWKLLMTRINSTPPLKKLPFEQGAVSELILSLKNDFLILKPDILNTPAGKIIRHNWFKDDTLFKLLLLDTLTIWERSKSQVPNFLFDWEDLLDQESFPNESFVKNIYAIKIKDFLSKLYYSIR